MQEEVIVQLGLAAAVLVSLLVAMVLRKRYPYFNFLEWFGTVFLFVAWYTLMISSTIEIIIPGKWVNGVQLAGFAAAYVVPPLILYRALAMRRKRYRSRHQDGTSQA